MDALSAADFEAHFNRAECVTNRAIPRLVGNEGMALQFQPDAIRRIAEIAFEVNERTENIGARRLHTVMERLLENVLFDAPDCTESMTVDAAYVDSILGALVEDEDLSRYIL